MPLVFDQLTRFLAEVWSVSATLAPWLLLGALAAALLHRFLPSGFVQRVARGRAGVVRAVLLGIPLPLCSCGVIPTGLGLRRDGASTGASVGFITATPQTGVDSMLVAAAFLGWPFAVFKAISALVIGISGGLLSDRFADKSADQSADKFLGTTHAEPPTARPQPTWAQAIDHGVDIIRSVAGWIVVGILASLR